jgi:hypothetical protein
LVSLLAPRPVSLPPAPALAKADTGALLKTSHDGGAAPALHGGRASAQMGADPTITR